MGGVTGACWFPAALSCALPWTQEPVPEPQAAGREWGDQGERIWSWPHRWVGARGGAGLREKLRVSSAGVVSPLVERKRKEREF